MEATALLPSRLPGRAGPVAASPSTQSRVLRATMLWRVASAGHHDGKSHWGVLATLSEPSGSYDGQALSPALSAQLAEPVWLDIDERCTFERIGVARRRSAAAERQWQLLVGLVEMALPQDASARGWTLEQEDSTGRYRAAYRRSEDDRRIERRKTLYVQARSPSQGVSLSIDIENARAVATTSAISTDALAVGWFDALEVEEHARALTEGKQRFVDVSTHLSLRRKPTNDGLAFWATPPEPSPVAWEPMATPTQAKRSTLRFAGQPPDPALSAMTAAQVAAAFSGLLSADRRKEDALRMMVQYLRLDDRHIDQVVALVRQGGFNANAQPFAFLALQLAGGGKARDVLIAATNDSSLPRAARLQALSALKDVPEADAQVVTALRALARQGGTADRERADAARLGLGALASRIGIDSPVRETVHDELARGLAQASSNEEMGIALAALGNSRNAAFAPLVKPQLTASAGQVRTAALVAYRRTGGELPIAGLLDRLPVEDYPPCVRELGKVLVAQAPRATASEIDRATALLAQTPPGGLAAEPLIAFLGAASGHSEAAMQALVGEFHRERNPTLLALIGRYVPTNRLP